MPETLDKKKPYWVSGKAVVKKTGWTKEEMRTQRKNNPDLWTVNKKGGYLYDINKIPEALLIK